MVIFHGYVGNDFSSDRQMYEMGEQIGSGTFGTVWRAKHSQPGT
jgi:serine/threonine protein kinase